MVDSVSMTRCFCFCFPNSLSLSGRDAESNSNSESNSPNSALLTELGIELELAFKKTQELGIELELAFEKTHELGIELELAFVTNSPTLTKFPSMSGILIEITASSCHLVNLITHY